MKGWTRNIAFTIILVLYSILIYAQSKAELEKKRKLQVAEIQYTKKLIAETSEKHKQNLEFLKVINKQISTRQSLINTIRKEINYLQDQIEMNNDVISSLKKDLENLKKEYANMVRFAYKNRNPYNRIGFILSAETINQSFKRLKLIQHYSDFRQKQMKLIEQTKSSIEEKVSTLKDQKIQKTRLLAREEMQRKSLMQDKANRSNIVDNLKYKERELKNQLKEKKRIAAELDRAIEALISAKGRFEDTPEAKLISQEFTKNKGKLPWPVEKGFISETYGKHEHSTLKGIYVFNNGIKIRTNKGSNARAVFNGKVQYIVSIPGAGNSVLVKHGVYYSVYSNLSDVYVKTGQNVTTKQELGKIRYDTRTGNTEIDLWMLKNTTKLNPVYWLYRK